VLLDRPRTNGQQLPHGRTALHGHRAVADEAEGRTRSGLDRRRSGAGGVATVGGGPQTQHQLERDRRDKQPYRPAQHADGARHVADRRSTPEAPLTVAPRRPASGDPRGPGPHRSREPQTGGPVAMTTATALVAAVIGARQGSSDERTAQGAANRTSAARRAADCLRTAVLTAAAAAPSRWRATVRPGRPSDTTASSRRSGRSPSTGCRAASPPTACRRSWCHCGGR